MRPLFPIPAVLAAILIASCADPETAADKHGDPEPVTIAIGDGRTLKLPVTFSGDLPCSDCIARRVTLTLRPDRVFLTRTIWVGDPEPNASYDLGRWIVDTASGKLILRGGADEDVQFAMLDPDAIRLLSEAGRAVTSVAATLVRARRVEQFDESLRLRGFFLHTRAGPIFGECASGKRWPVAPEAEYFALERGYRAAHPRPGTPLFVSIDGRLVLRRGEAGEREMLVVERIDRLWSDGDCQTGPTSPVPMRGRWQLVQART